MRVFVFFDLPVDTTEDRRNYRRFRKFLLQNGFLMLQESVYCRMLLNGSIERTLTDNLRKNKPPSGLVTVLTVTEKQFAGMEYLVGENKSDVIDTDERVLIL